MRILFVGQAPSAETDGKPPFVGRCGKFLAELMDTTQEQMLLDHDFINVFDRWPGKGYGGDKFPMPEAKQLAKAKLDQLRDRQMVVLLGSNVARAFNASQFRYLEFYEMRNPDNFSDCVAKAMSVVPHPSGVNRYYNNPRNRLVVGEFLRRLASKNPENGPFGP